MLGAGPHRNMADLRWTWTVPRLEFARHRAAYLAFLSAHIVTAAWFVLDRSPGTAAALDGFPLDDAWIHMVYARSLAEFGGYAYNPGVLETGATSPGWSLLVAPLFSIAAAAGGGLVVLVKILGTACLWLASMIAYRVVLAFALPPSGAWAAGLVIALDPALSFSKLSGMEVAAASAALLWILLSIAERRLLGAAIGCAVAPMLRPESMVACIPAACALAAGLRSEGRPREIVRAALPAILVLSAWTIFCLSVTGHPLPNTYYLKHALAAGMFWKNIFEIGRVLLPSVPWFGFGTGVIVLVIGARRLFAVAPEPKALDDTLARVAILAMPVTYLVGVAWALSLVDSDGYYSERYVHPALPLLYVTLGAGYGVCVGYCMRAVGSSPSRRDRSTGASALALLALGLFGLPRGLRDRAGLFAWNCQNIEEMQVAVGRWLRGRTPRGQWIASSEAGAIRFHSERPTVDLQGLNDHHVREGHLREILTEKRPAYFVTFPSLYPRAITRNPRMELVGTWRAANYTICNCPGQDAISVYAPREAGAPPIPPPATDSPHIDSMSNILRAAPSGSPVWIVSRRDDASAAERADGLSRAFRQAGWDVKALEKTDIRVKPGIFLFVANDDVPTYVDIARRALEAAGFSPNIGTGYAAYADQMLKTRNDWQGFRFAAGQTYWLVVGKSSRPTPNL